MKKKELSFVVIQTIFYSFLAGSDRLPNWVCEGSQGFRMSLASRETSDDADVESHYERSSGQQSMSSFFEGNFSTFHPVILASELCEQDEEKKRELLQIDQMYTYERRAMLFRYLCSLQNNPKKFTVQVAKKCGGPHGMHLAPESVKVIVDLLILCDSSDLVWEEFVSMFQIYSVGAKAVLKELQQGDFNNDPGQH